MEEIASSSNNTEISIKIEDDLWFDQDNNSCNLRNASPSNNTEVSIKIEDDLWFGQNSNSCNVRNIDSVKEETFDDNNGLCSALYDVLNDHDNPALANARREVEEIFNRAILRLRKPNDSTSKHFGEVNSEQTSTLIDEDSGSLRDTEESSDTDKNEIIIRLKHIERHVNPPIEAETSIKIENDVGESSTNNEDGIERTVSSKTTLIEVKQAMEKVFEKAINKLRKDSAVGIPSSISRNSSKMECDVSKPKKLYKCDICGKVYRLKRYFKSHIKSHFEEKQFKCDFCEKLFKLRRCLREHLKSHSGEKPYDCGICGKRLLGDKHLTAHLSLHMGKRDFWCDVCGKEFAEKSKLQLHLPIHGEKNLTNVMDVRKVFIVSTVYGDI